MLIFGGNNSGGGGGGAGTVTSVATASNSLANNSAPNPIVGAGTVEFELQVIDILLADFSTALAGATLLPGVTYHITDPPFPLDDMWIEATATDQIDDQMSGTSLGRFVQCYYDFEQSTLCEVYCPARNNRTSRFNFGGTDCIETFDTTTNRYRNCVIVDSNFSDDGTTFADGLIVDENCDITLANGAFADGVHVEAGCIFSIDEADVNCSSFGARCDIALRGNVVYESMQWFDPENISITTGLSNKEYHPALNELQQFIPVNAGTDDIADSYATNIFVNLNPAGVIPAYTLQLPATPLNGQTFHIGSTDAITALTLTGNGHTLVGGITTLATLGSVVYYYDLASDTYFLV